MNTNSCETNCDVLVVGAGPTGLTLAAHLLARGVRTRVIDKDPGTPRLSRAIGIAPRTLETLDMMGIADRFLDEGHRVRGIRLYAGSKSLLGIDMAHSGSPYRFLLSLPQQRTETLLRTRVAELGGNVETGVELLDFTAGQAAVRARVREETGRERTITAGFIVGCDGAHSRVRHLLAAPFTGQPYPWDWVLADAHLDWHGTPNEVHVFTRPDGLPMLCVPITPELWRVSLPTPGDRGGLMPTLEEVQGLVDERGPGGIEVSDPETLTTFRCQIRSTSVYRRGRALLAGDAAHIHSPAGGQGMNTGILDATNLAWKLALVVSKRAPDGLLDSYGAERASVAAQVLGFTEKMVRFGTAPRSLNCTVRNAALPALRLPAVQRRLAGRMAQTLVRYPGDPLTRPARVGGLPRPGARMSNVAVHTVDGQDTLHAVLRRGRLVLRVAGGMQPDLAPYRDQVEVVSAPLGRSHGCVLVRPDGYVAAVGTGTDTTAVLDYVQELAPTVGTTEYAGV
jgi:2-polyprenyl-6-methoxyphenol hydroxylase-like FAD-dependent oxidoreductase